MPIEVDQHGSPGWWMHRLSRKLNDRKRVKRLEDLHHRYHGRPPLPMGAENAMEAFQAFQRMARTNFAELIVSAVSERMTPVGFRTAVDGDETGDREAARVWTRAGLDVEASTVHDLMLNLHEAFVIVGEVDPETGAPVITAEDPRQMVAATDPAQPRRLRAALKYLYDEEDERDRLYVYLPSGEVHVADRDGRSTQPGRMTFSPRAWSWNERKSGKLRHDRIPVVRFANKDDVGEYEKHLDLLDRINHQILQRMVIATMQAFRQRAVKGLPLTDKQGNKIDYSDVFTMDPAALWQLPATAEMWESGTVDLNGVLQAVKDDVQQVGAVSRTPMHMLMPSGANQTAEGANMQREGLVFKVEDRLTRTKHPWAQVMSLVFLQLEQGQRADLSKLETLWAPAERLSLNERANAAAQARGDVPWRSRMIKIWHFTPEEVDRMESERADEQLFAQQVAAATAAGQPQPPVDALETGAPPTVGEATTPPDSEPAPVVT